MISTTDLLSDRIGEILGVLECLTPGPPPTLANLRRSRVDCVKAVADIRGGDSRTVADKCWRQLGLEGIDKFDDLVWMWVHARDPRLREALDSHIPSTHPDADRAAIGAFFDPGTALSVWWVNQGTTYAAAKESGSIWAPRVTGGGTTVGHHVSVGRLRPGDVVFHYANSAVRAVSRVTESAVSATRPYEQYAADADRVGYLVRTEYEEFPNPIPIDQIDQAWRAEEGGPFERGGDVAQKYLTQISEKFWSRLLVRHGGALQEQTRNDLYWERMLLWMELARRQPDFDSEERDYKLRIAETVRGFIEDGTPSDWSEQNWRVLGGHNNLLGWRTEAHLNEWVSEGDNGAHLQTVIRESDRSITDLGERFDLTDSLLSTGDFQPGMRLGIGAFFNFGLAPTDAPMVRARTFEQVELAVGLVSGSALEPGERYRHHLKFASEVDARLRTRGVSIRDMLDTQSLIFMAHEAISEWTSDEESAAIVDSTYEVTPDVLAAQIHIPVDELEELLEIIEERKQVIFEGPPGGGKTFVADKVGRYLTKNDLVGSPDHRFVTIQFHQSYGYEDFIQGIRPRTDENGQLVYEVRDGVFKTLCDTAALEPNRKFVILVDEINRGDISRIFGELLLLLEYRDSEVGLAYAEPGSDRFKIPPNVYLLGTMNTADRSLTQIDYALRRRFYFYRLIPVIGGAAPIFASWLEESGIESDAQEDLLGLFVRLNDKITSELGEHFQIGHSYFMKNGESIADENVLQRVFNRAIIPLLEEYFFNHRDRGEILDGFRPEVLRGEIGAGDGD